MKFRSIVRNVLPGVITLGLTQAAFAVTDEKFHTLQEQFNQLADQVEENSKGSSSDTTVGGYGELHYNNLSNGQGSDKKELDLHRFVIFVNHEFNDNIRFFSEFEIEHALVKDTNDGSNGGEVEVEQAYVQFDLGEHTKANAGVFLIPVGILNETHEPPAFYGVERNPVEKNIIPATWWEGGAMLSGHYDSGFSYDLALTSGLDGGTSIRGGRQKTSKASADNLAATVRIKYTGARGLEVAATLQLQDDMTQGIGTDPKQLADITDAEELAAIKDVESATLIETHARYSIADFTITGLYARWDIDGNGASAANKDTQDGAYIEASYKVSPKFGIFVRQNQWDNGGTTGNTKKAQTDIGVNYWPHENVVVKADYQLQNNDDNNDFDGFNLGVGYQF